MLAVVEVEFITVLAALAVLVEVEQEVYLAEMEVLGLQIPAVVVEVQVALLAEQQQVAVEVLEL
jgi:hypothetical protein